MELAVVSVSEKSKHRAGRLLFRFRESRHRTWRKQEGTHALVSKNHDAREYSAREYIARERRLISERYRSH